MKLRALDSLGSLTVLLLPQNLVAIFFFSIIGSVISLLHFNTSDNLVDIGILIQHLLVHKLVLSLGLFIAFFLKGLARASSLFMF